DNLQAEWDAYVQIIDERNQRILTLLESPQTLDQLVQAAPIYQKFPYQERLLRYWERMMIHQHLLELEAVGKVVSQGSTFEQSKK
ncbi:MAG: hypothetical protein Q6361_08050, partial [Candidatus Hermodarchaeota archaeon]|nr:hypothetical protein [Candidatus Hermodarchaeota archaeon]